MGPARATVGRDVLIAHVSKVVDSINVRPVPSRGHVIDGLEGGVDAANWQDIRFDAAWLIWADTSGLRGCDKCAHKGHDCE